MSAHRKFYEINSKTKGRFWVFEFSQLIMVGFFGKRLVGYTTAASNK